PPAPKIGEIALEHVLGSRQVSGRAERERQDPPAGVDRVLKRDRQLEGRPLELAERGGQLPREEPERGGGERAGRLWGRRVGDLGDVAALNAHGGLMPDLRDFPHTEAPGRPGGREALARRGEVTGLVDRVGSRHEERGVRAGGERAAHGIRRAERLRLPGVANGEPEAGAVADERPNLFGKVADDDSRHREARAGELTEKRRDDRSSLDRKDRLWPPLGEWPQPTALARRQDDGVERHTVSERRLTRPRRRRKNPSWERFCLWSARSSLRARRTASRASPSGPKRAAANSREKGFASTRKWRSSCRPSPAGVALGGASSPWSARKPSTSR